MTWLRQAWTSSGEGVGDITDNGNVLEGNCYRLRGADKSLRAHGFNGSFPRVKGAVRAETKQWRVITV